MQTDLDTVRLPELVEVAPGLSVILVVPTGAPIDSLELAVIDLPDNLDTSDDWERSVLFRLRELIGRLRRASEVSKAELLLVVMNCARRIALNPDC